MRIPIAERACEFCGSIFKPDRRSDSPKHRNAFCSRPCAAANRRGKPVAANNMSFTPDSTKAERVRAHGLVNERIKRGIVKRPTRCLKRGRQSRIDAHHPDYSEPDLVSFLCRSCHMKAHRSLEFEKEVAALARHARREVAA